MAASSSGPDVVVVGGGNAALCAALSAAECGARVMVLEAAPKDRRGGNSFFTGGALRFPIEGVADAQQLIPDLTAAEVEKIEIAPLSSTDLYTELCELSEYQTDPDLTLTLVDQSFDGMKWLAEHRVRFALAFGRHAVRQDDMFHFVDGNPIEFWGGGAELVQALYRSADSRNIDIRYSARAMRLADTPDGIAVSYREDNRLSRVEVPAVVLACGGFEASPEMRARYLGPGWDLARVRGTEFNLGDGIRMAVDLGAQTAGHWSGCHAVAWDANSPLTGDRSFGDSFQRHSYPHGIVVNRDGYRFLDEGADFHTRTYAKYGGEILHQPGRVAYQLFDQKTVGRLREEYRQRRTTKFESSNLAEIARHFSIDEQQLLQTVREFNDAVADTAYDPTRLDGKGTTGISPRKSNWALPLDTPPYVAFAVTCGITFTFGGVKISPEAEVLDIADQPINGLYAAGELVGGLFYHNYPSGAGLISGAVFGRLAGRNAATRALDA